MENDAFYATIWKMTHFNPAMENVTMENVTMENVTMENVTMESVTMEKDMVLYVFQDCIMRLHNNILI